MKRTVFLYFKIDHSQTKPDLIRPTKKGKAKLNPVFQEGANSGVDDASDGENISDAWDEEEMNLAFSRSRYANY